MDQKRLRTTALKEFKTLIYLIIILDKISLIGLPPDETANFFFRTILIFKSQSLLISYNCFSISLKRKITHNLKNTLVRQCVQRNCSFTCKLGYNKQIGTDKICSL